MSDDGSEYVSNHDRGAFGKLLAEAKALGCGGIEFYVDFERAEDVRWDVSVYDGRAARVYGRTGEEALRRLVDELQATDVAR